jgi:hypothetical protein
MNKVIEGMNQYCGPAVLSIITGKSTDECASILAEVCGQREIREIKLPDLIKTCKKLRFYVIERDADCSLFSLMHMIHNYDGMYIVVVKKHVIAVEVSEGNVLLCDNHTKEPINGAASARLSQLALACFKVEPKPPAQLLEEKLIWSEHSYNSNQIFIDLKIESIFQDNEDNYIRHVGYITARDRKELKTIRDRMLIEI